MKTSITLIATLILLVSCGKDLRRMIGADYNNKTNRIEKDVDTLEELIKKLQNDYESLVYDFDVVQTQIDSLSSQDSSMINTMISIQNSLQSQINNVLAQIAAIESNELITEFIDPCGDGVGYDEVLVRTSSGKIIAYFESGNKRFLTILTPGSYITTDQQACQFAINNQNQVIF